MGFEGNMPGVAKRPVRGSETRHRSKTDETEITCDILPSQFLPYATGTTVTYRPYTFREIKKISKSTLTRLRLFETIASGITVKQRGKTVDAFSMLTLSDFLYIAMMRKLASLGESKYTATQQCKKCDSTIIHHFTASALEFEDLEVTAFPVEATINGTTISFTPMTVSQYFEYTTIVEDKKDDDDFDEEILSFALQAVGMDTDVSYDIIGSALASDLPKLREVDEKLFHSLSPVPATCKECDTKTTIELDGEGVLIEPFRG